MLRHMLAEHSKDCNIDPKPKKNGVKKDGKGRPRKKTDTVERDRLSHDNVGSLQD